MIWIYENLTEKDTIKLKELNPYMDYHWGQKNNTHYWQTYCERLDIINGKVQDVRKAKFFNLSQTRQGFICDDINEAQEICAIRDGFSRPELVEKNPDIIEYLDTHKSIWIRNIAVPVINIIKYFADNDPGLLDILDLGLLGKYKVDYTPYIKRKSFEGTTVE